MSDYLAIQSAARTEKLRTWCAWFAGNVIMYVIVRATRHVNIVSTVTQALAVVVFLLLTVTALRMNSALNRKITAARRQVLGDDL
ncbi:hypothetical protein [Streptomyces sp. NPDC096013]|uniref:hypothetical protein n=1 Tax=Streptomyces sp. NPDC096013 TaxID=3366069 RepID=UPI0037F31C91